MKVLISDESGEWRAEFVGEVVENNGVMTTPQHSVALSVANVEAKWGDILKSIIEYVNLNS